MEDLLKTPAEIEREKRQQIVINRYLSLRNQYPEASDNRLFKVMEKEPKVGYTSVRIRSVLIDNGIIKPKVRL